MQGPSSFVETAATAIAPPTRPARVWPAVCAMLLAPLAATACVAVSIGIAMLLGGGLRTGMDSHELMRRLGESLVGVAIVLVPSQAVFFGVASAGAAASAQPWRERLALRVPVASVATIALLLAGILGVTGLAVLFSPLLGEQSEHTRDLLLLLGGTRGAQAVAVTLLASLLPAACEELLFRGYAQTRLVQRFGAWRGIAIASVFFALAHFDPQHIVTVFPAALAFGCVAWLTRSTWVSIAAHALNNLAALSLMRVLPEDMELPRNALTLGSVGALIALGALGVRRARAQRALEDVVPVAA